MKNFIFNWLVMSLTRNPFLMLCYNFPTFWCHQSFIPIVNCYVCAETSVKKVNDYCAAFLISFSQMNCTNLMHLLSMK